MTIDLRLLGALALVIAIGNPFNAIAKDPVQYFPADAPGPEFSTVPDIQSDHRDPIGRVPGTDFRIGGNFGGRGLSLFGAIGGFAALANAQHQAQQHAATLGDLTRTDLRTMLRGIIPPAAQSNDVAHVYYRLNPEVALSFNNDSTHFTLTCAIVAELPNHQRAWYIGVRTDENFDTASPASMSLIAQRLSPCLQNAYQAFAQFVAHRDQVRSASLSIVGAAVNRPVNFQYLRSDDGSRILLVALFGLTSLPLADVTFSETESTPPLPPH
jgi:hypothetical protein